MPSKHRTYTEEARQRRCSTVKDVRQRIADPSLNHVYKFIERDPTPTNGGDTIGIFQCAVCGRVKLRTIKPHRT